MIEAPILRQTGQVIENSVDITSNAFGQTWSQTRSWVGSNDASLNGNGWAVSDLPTLTVLQKQHYGDGGILEVVGIGGSTPTFRAQPNSTNFTPMGSLRASLAYVPSSTDSSLNRIPGYFNLTDAQGNVTSFYDVARDNRISGNSDPDPGTVLEDTSAAYSGIKYKEIYGLNSFPLKKTNQWFSSTGTLGTSTAAYRFGAFKGYVSASGTYSVTTNYDSTTGNLTSVVRGDGSGAYERWEYTYGAVTNPSTGATVTLVTSVLLKNGSSSSDPGLKVRQADYQYYTGDTSASALDSADGRLGDLKLVTIKDYQKSQTTAEIVDQKYYRYYKFHSNAVVQDPDLPPTSPTNVSTDNNDSDIESHGWGGSGGTDTTYGRVGGDNTVMSGLKAVVEGANFARLAANYPTYEAVPDRDITPSTDSNGDGVYSNDDVRSYANNLFRYERYDLQDLTASEGSPSAYRAIEESAAAAGCSSCSAGLGNYKLVYQNTQGNLSDGTISANKWNTKTIEYLPDETNADTNNDGYIDSGQWDDNDKLIVYTNEAGQAILSVLVDAHGTSSTADDTREITFKHYDANDNVDYLAHPSAVNGYNEFYDDLTGYSVGNPQGFLSLHAGFVEHFQYATSTTATASASGDVAKMLQSSAVRKGIDGSDVPVMSYDYIQHQYNGTTISKLADSVAYMDVNHDGTDDANTAHYAYTWQPDSSSVATNQVASVVQSAPAVNAARNGSGVATATATVFDAVGRPVWTKDADGFINYTQYDNRTGSVIKSIQDVNTTLTSQFTNLPSGWATPSGGGLNLVMTFAVDGLGRTTRMTDPKGNITYIVYNDANHETRTYTGWDATSGTTTGPIVINRTYWPSAGASSGQRTAYKETVTSSATPSTSGSAGSYVPTGAETLTASNIQSLTRNLQNDAGQAVESDAYISMSGLTYSVANPRLGSATNDSSSGNYHATLYGYDGDGRVKRVQSPTGTITRTVFDADKRAVSTWVGTDDTPTSGYWSPSNTSGTNLVQVSDSIYDGDGNLLQGTSYPSGSTSPRVTQMRYDWRDRLVMVKRGVSATESTNDQRPITYYRYDNQGNVVSTEGYDGDQVAVPPQSGPVLLDGSFGSGFREYSAWTFNSLADIPEGDSSKPVSLNTNSTGQGQITQTIANWNEQNYQIQFDATDFVYAPTLDVKVDGVLVNSVVVGLTQTYTTPSFHVSAGTHTISFSVEPVSSFAEAYLDNISIVDPSIPTVPPFQPTSSLLRSKITTDFDEAGRPYASHVFSVDPSSGSVSSSSIDSYTWYDNRDEVIKSQKSGLAASKMSYDGAGRMIASYTTDAGGDAAAGATGNWADAGNVTGDIVVNQMNTTYDADGNVILTMQKRRFHDATGTGALGRPTSGIRARLYYTPYWYDAANRLVGKAEIGTNFGSDYTRSNSVPARSDTKLVTTYGYDAAGRLNNTTDPRGLVNLTSFDLLGRTVKTVANYVDGTPSNSDDQTTAYTYDGDDHVLTLSAQLPSSAIQTTQYVYGATQSRGDGLDSNDVLIATYYPDLSTGAASSGQAESYKTDAIGERIRYTDRNGSTHAYGYDIVGRMVGDTVTTLGSGVDGSVRKIGTSYNTQGLVEKITSYADTLSSSVANEVQRQYNGLGQITAEYQSHSGSVSLSTTPAVLYSYGALTSGSRLSSMTYPNGRVLNYNYASGLDDAVGRLSSLSDTSGTLESYSYLGMDIVVKRAHPQSGVDLSYIKAASEGTADAGDQYTGLDRFNRVVNQKWVNGSGTIVDRNTYSYDRDGNVTAKANPLNTALSETYSYDGLNRLTTAAVPGNLSMAGWTYDAMGNITSRHSDGGPSKGSTVNSQNEMITLGGNTLAYDANGNLTTDQDGNTLVYDAWNRLMAQKAGSTVLTNYLYDGDFRRIVAGPTESYFNNQWQEIENSSNSGNTIEQFVWSKVYDNALIERDSDSDANGTLDQRLYITQDAIWNVTGIINSAGSVVERFNYDPFGNRSILNTSWGSVSDNYGFELGFQGGKIDYVSDRILFRFRDYNLLLIRFNTRDLVPIQKADSINSYEFGLDNPLRYYDPNGLSACTCSAPTPPPPPGFPTKLQIFAQTIIPSTSGGICTPTPPKGKIGTLVEICTLPYCWGSCSKSTNWAAHVVPRWLGLPTGPGGEIWENDGIKVHGCIEFP